MTPREQLFRAFYEDRVLAHSVLFAHRHPDPSPPFHEDMIRDWHGGRRYVLDMVFREGAKSTIAEEAITLMACFKEFKNGLIVGSSRARATERLHAIKHEMETNEDLRRVFGELVGPVWADDEIVTASGVRLLACGKGQSLRGAKYEDRRPDMIFFDDLEEDMSDVSTPESRAKTVKWFFSVLKPAGDSQRLKMRGAATPLHPESLPLVLSRDPEWKPGFRRIPIYYIDEDGERRSSWPERRSMEDIDILEASYRSRGDIESFNREYMVLAETPEAKLFKAEMIRIEPRVRTWQAVYSMTDPARTTSAKSATTGRVVWSWIGSKLVVWDGVARRWMPDEIIGDLFDVHAAYNPVYLGFEEDGLNQWALQAIRQEMVKRGVALPLKAMKAPPMKLNFIRGLQPFFQAREVEFAKELPDLKSQLLGFPTGDIDAPNALAYALLMRPGAPVYDDFKGKHIAEDLDVSPGRPVWLCLNATPRCVTGCLAQSFDGQVRILGDVVREGDPLDVTADLVADARVLAGNVDLRLTAGPLHFDKYNNVGLRQAVIRIPREVRAGVAPGNGQPMVRELLQRDRHGFPALYVSDKARWTLNAFAGGYARAIHKGMLADYAEEGIYRTLMEGLESFVGLLDLGFGVAGERARFNAETPQGRAYHSMVGGNAPPRETKGDWNALLRGDR